MDQSRIDFLLAEADRHLVGTQAIIPLLIEIKDELFKIKVGLSINEKIYELDSKLEKLLNPTKIKDYNEEYNGIISKIDNWPIAINPDLICQNDSEPDKEYRAESIIELIITDYLKDMKFLDFGCGEGHVVAAAKNTEAKLAIGYDIKEQGWNRFDQDENFILCDNKEEINRHAPYDVILLFDVLDHLEEKHPVELLVELKQLLSPNGKIYVRCHPFCSRYGTHLYETGLNKAFIHLVLDDIELTRLGGYSNKKTLPIVNPIETYQSWFEEAGLKVISEEISKEGVEEDIENFFSKDQLIWNRIYKNWGEGNPIEHMAINSIDYILKSRTAQVLF